jgi:hypothetical protein
MNFGRADAEFVARLTTADRRHGSLAGETGETSIIERDWRSARRDSLKEGGA